MTRLAVMLAAGAALCGCAGAPFVQRPPARYQADTTVVVRLHRTEAIAGDCAALGADANPRTVGCFAGLGIQLPNPCGWPDPYAQVFCHELAHANGWARNHPND
jgi:hypothetical protein